MNDEAIVQELDAEAGWEANRLTMGLLKDVRGQRDSQARWAAYQQPKVDAFNTISRIFILESEKTMEENLNRIREIVQAANQKCAAIERNQVAERKLHGD